MAYSELVKDFERIRDYMRQFYVFGFRGRNEYNAKSARSYDNEKRRIESWLGDYMSFRLNREGKQVFLSLDSRTVASNPLYAAFKAKSFTDGDITFHFYIMDLLADGDKLSVAEILDGFCDRYTSFFENAYPLDESSVRKKLREYTALGLLSSEKRGRELVYFRNVDDIPLDKWQSALSFFSEVSPVGVVGSYISDRLQKHENFISFKHHYILHSLDSQIMCRLLLAMDEHKKAEITVTGNRGDRNVNVHNVFPMKIFVSTQTGREYVLCYHYRLKKPIFFRIDAIHDVKLAEAEEDYEKYSGYFEKLKEKMWGVSLGEDFSFDHIEMMLHIEKNEKYIVKRLEREKRCGNVSMLDENTYKFTADVYDAMEMLPWIRTFTGRIKSLECTNSLLKERFYSDFAELSKMYGGDGDAL